MAAWSGGESVASGNTGWSNGKTGQGERASDPNEKLHGDDKAAAAPVALPDTSFDTANNVLVLRDDNIATAVSIMYVTASPTFTGSIAGYTTVFGADGEGNSQNTAVGAAAAAAAASGTPQSRDGSQRPNQQQNQDQSQQLQQSVQQTQPTFDLATSQTQQDQTSTSTEDGSGTQEQRISTAESSRTRQTSLSTSSKQSVPPSSSTPTVGSQALQSATQSPDKAKQEHGMSGGATAGTVIGLLLALALLAGAGYYWWRRRQAKGERLDDEKSFISPVPPAVGPGRAPRLSLGPGIIPSFDNPAQRRPPMASNPFSEARLTVFPSAAAADASMANPFGQQSEIAAANAPIPLGQTPGAAATGALRPAPSQRSNPFSDSNATAAPDAQTLSPPQGAADPADPTVAAAVAVKPRTGTVPPSNVHRVQLNFEPTMDDELELQAGQVVRIMHEYDDGWALCVRMDRSKQGVVPRTCLSKSPIRPRLTNPSAVSADGQPRNFSFQQGRPRSASAGRQSEYPGTIAQGSPRTTYRQTARRSSSVGGFQVRELEPISPDDSASLRGVRRSSGPGAAR